mmetsp:Transcript_36080/g.90759  ORF Transcript_36080/g.90759 Transcript_36080/m.90759 type:complete len:145 (-) Transcript_36080:467-901(-)
MLRSNWVQSCSGTYNDASQTPGALEESASKTKLIAAYANSTAQSQKPCNNLNAEAKLSVQVAMQLISMDHARIFGMDSMGLRHVAHTAPEESTTPANTAAIQPSAMGCESIIKALQSSRGEGDKCDNWNTAKANIIVPVLISLL